MLDKILRLLPPDLTSNGRVSFLDETIKDWLTRTGEVQDTGGKPGSIE